MRVSTHVYGVFTGLSVSQLLLGQHCGMALLRSEQ